MVGTDMHEQLEKRVIEVVKGGSVRIPPFPAAAMELMRLVQRDDYSQADLTKVVKSDQSFAITALRLANSPLFYRGHAVTELSRAVQCLGASELNRIAISITLRDSAFAAGPLVSLRRRAWREGVLAGHICQKLAQLAGQDGEEAFTVGLLHDVGRLLALSAIEQVLAADPQSPSLTEAQWWELVERFRVELGMVLAAKWKLPEVVERVISGSDDDEVAALLRHVSVADELMVMMDEQPHLTEADIGQIAELSTAECSAIARLLPEAVNALLAYDAEPFGKDGASKVKASVELHVAAINAVDQPVGEMLAAAVASPQPAGARAVEEVDVSGGSDQSLHGTVVEAGANQLVLRLPGPVRENLLVKVKWSKDSMQLCARVKSCDVEGNGAVVHLLPFALSKQQNADWRAHLAARAA